MSLETGTWISDLVGSNPSGTDTVNFGANHLRLIKTVLQNTFPRTAKAFSFPILTVKSANYTVLSADEGTDFLCNATSAGFTMTLPQASTLWNGFRVKFKKTDSSANAVTIAPNGTDLIDQVNASITLPFQNSYVTLVCDGAGQWITESRNSGLYNMDYYIVAPVLNQVYVMCTETAFAGSPVLFYGLTQGGSGTMALQINNSTIVTLNINGSGITTAPMAAINFAAGSLITVVPTASSSMVKISGGIQYARTQA